MRSSFNAWMASTTKTMVLPEPMPTYLAVGSKWSSTALTAALRFAVSMSAAIGIGTRRRGEEEMDARVSSGV